MIIALQQNYYLFHVNFQYCCDCAGRSEFLSKSVHLIHNYQRRSRPDAPDLGPARAASFFEAWTNRHWALSKPHSCPLSVFASFGSGCYFGAQACYYGSCFSESRLYFAFPWAPIIWHLIMSRRATDSDTPHRPSYSWWTQAFVTVSNRSSLWDSYCRPSAWTRPNFIVEEVPWVFGSSHQWLSSWELLT